MFAEFHKDGEEAPCVAAPRKKHHKNVRRARCPRRRDTRAQVKLHQVVVERRQISRHMDRFACLCMRRRLLSRLRRRASGASLAHWASDGVELSAASRALGVATMAARASPPGSRDLGASGRARERRVRPRGAGGSTPPPGPWPLSRR